MSRGYSLYRLLIAVASLVRAWAVGAWASVFAATAEPACCNVQAIIAVASLVVEHGL